MKNFLYFMLYLCCFVLLASLLLAYLPADIVAKIPAKVLDIVNNYVLPYGALATSGLFGCIYLFGKNPLKIILFILHCIIVAALVIAIFFPETWAKILNVFVK